MSQSIITVQTLYSSLSPLNPPTFLKQIHVKREKWNNGEVAKKEFMGLLSPKLLTCILTLIDVLTVPRKLPNKLLQGTLSCKLVMFRYFCIGSDGTCSYQF